MEIHCQVGAYMYAKFQRNRPSNYRVIVLLPNWRHFVFVRGTGTCIRGHPYTSTIVKYLEGGMKLPYKKDGKLIGRVVAKISAWEKRRLGRPLMLSFVCFSTKVFAGSLRSIVIRNALAEL